MSLPRYITLALLLPFVVGMHVTAAPAMRGAGDAPLPDSCVTQPTQLNCSSFTYPEASAAADIDKLCHAMHFMAACSVNKACNASAGDASKVSSRNPNICEPFNQVATVCRLDTGMGRMAGCNNINSMCIDGGKVPICSEMTGMRELPTTETVNKQVRSICEEMTMDGCEKCMPSWQAGRTWADCDLLAVYGELCYAMPEMGQCGEWHSMCSADPSLLFCHGYDASGSSSGGGGGGGGAKGGPVMKMYFFEDLPFYLLFKSWTPGDKQELGAAWAAIFALGLLYELLQMLYGRFESNFWAKQHARAAAAAAVRRGGCCGSTPATACHNLDIESGEHGRALAEAMEESTDGMKAPLNGANCNGTVEADLSQSCCAGRNAAAAAASNGSATHHHMLQQKQVASLPAAKLTDPAAAAAAGMNGYHSGSRQSSRGRNRGSNCVQSYFEPQLLLMDVIRGVSRFVLAGLAYLLMLAAMSYHVAIFFAVIAGVGVGSMLFGRWRFKAGTAEGYSHCGCGSS